MSDPKLVQQVLDEEYTSDHHILEWRQGPVAEFLHGSDDTEAHPIERARQAALGKKALRLLDKLVAAECSFDGDADEACAIVAELRGGK